MRQRPSLLWHRCCLECGHYASEICLMPHLEDYRAKGPARWILDLDLDLGSGPVVLPSLCLVGDWNGHPMSLQVVLAQVPASGLVQSPAFGHSQILI